MSLVITNSSFAGEFAGKYIAAALLTGDTLAKNEITILPNVRFKSVLQKASLPNIVRNADCEFQTGQGTLTLTEQVLQVEEFQVNIQLCKKELHETWQALEMGYSTFAEMPASFTDFVLARVAASVADKTETNIWQGVNANVGEFDGLATLLAADAALPAGQEIAAAAITSANVIAQMGLVADAIPTTIFGKEDLRLYVSSNVARAYTRALGGFAAAGDNAGYESKGTNQVLGQLYFDGIQIVVSKGMANNTMIAAEKSNLFFGTGLLSDQNEVRVIDMSETDGSQNVRIVMRFTAGVQYGEVTDIVLYA
tara:strand:+ start:2515 stop:3444 length:930 start_codon:yes stop_codon:yes gene_type:complete